MKFPGYKRILGPEILSRPVLVEVDGESVYACRKVRTREDYIAWHEDLLFEAGGDTWLSEEPVHAEIREGRWLAQCRWCRLHHRLTPMLTRPDWSLACCSVCGARYEGSNVVFPDDPLRSEIIAVLLLRPFRENQNWLQRQTVEDLVRENEQHGVGK